MGHKRHRVALALAAVAAVYIVLAFRILSLDAVYSVDIAVKYAQAQSLADHHFRSLDIPYRASAIDPARWFQPFRPPYLINVGGQTQAVWSASTAVFNGVFVRIWGYRGMVAASLIAAVIALWGASWLSRESVPAAMPIILGLATPMWFFATVGWEHAPGVAFATGAWVVAYRRGTAWHALVAGLLLGVGAALREEVLLLAPGLALVVWWQTRRWTPLFAVVVGVTTMLAASVALDVWWFARPVAAHIASSSHVVRDLLHIAAPPQSEVNRLVTLRDRYATVIQYWLLGYFDNGAIAAGVGAVVLGALASLYWNVRWPILAVAVVLTGLAASDTWTLLREPRWLSGLYRLSPFLAFAVLPMPSGSRRSDGFRTIVVAASAAYIATTFIAADLIGGKGFPRLLLPLTPLLAVSAWVAIVAYLRSPDRIARWIGGFGLALVALSLASHLTGVMPAYVARNASAGRVFDFLRRAPETVVVADDVTTAHALLPLYFRKTLLLADKPLLASALADRVEASGVQRLLMVTRDPHNRPSLPGYDASELLVAPDATVLAWNRAPIAPPPAGEHVVTDLIEAFPHAADARPAHGLEIVDAVIMGEAKRAIAVQQPAASRITWAATIPKGGWLEVSMAVPPEAWQPGDGLMFSVGIVAGGDYEQRFIQIVDPLLNPNDRRWRHAAIDLSTYAGRDVRIVFNTRWWTPRTDGTTGTRALWGAPRIVVR